MSATSRRCPACFPDYKALIVRAGADGRELATARWGMPSSSKALMDATKRRAEKLQAKGKPVDFKELLRMEPDGGTTNIRNAKCQHWTRWLGRREPLRGAVQLFQRVQQGRRRRHRFAFDDSRPLACSPASGRPGRPSGRPRKAKPPRPLWVPHDGGERRSRRHPPKAMPVILRRRRKSKPG